VRSWSRAGAGGPESRRQPARPSIAPAEARDSARNPVCGATRRRAGHRPAAHDVSPMRQVRPSAARESNRACRRPLAGSDSLRWADTGFRARCWLALHPVLLRVSPAVAGSPDLRHRSAAGRRPLFGPPAPVRAHPPARYRAVPFSRSMLGCRAPCLAVSVAKRRSGCGDRRARRIVRGRPLRPYVRPRGARRGPCAGPRRCRRYTKPSRRMSARGSSAGSPI
jgi:hypothetical protein